MSLRLVPGCAAATALTLFATLLPAPTRAATLALVSAVNPRLEVTIQRIESPIPQPTYLTIDLTGRLSGSLSLDSFAGFDAVGFSLDLLGEPIVVSSVLPGSLPLPLTFAVDDLAWDRPGPGQPPVLLQTYQGQSVGLFDTYTSSMAGSLQLANEPPVVFDLHQDRLEIDPYYNTIIPVQVHNPGLVLVGGSGELSAPAFGASAYIVTATLIHARVTARLVADRLVFAPEPGATLLGGIALAGLALLRGARRRRTGCC